MLELVKEMNLDRRQGQRVVPHGFRSTLRTWAAEETNFPDELVKAALGQTVGNKADAAYQGGDLFEKRRKLMKAWADFCMKPAAQMGR